MPAILLWEWNYILDKWEKVPASVLSIRKVGAGLVIAGAHKLYWISCNPSVAASEWELTDDLDGSGDIELDHHHPERESHNTNLVPPKQFTTGIYLKTYTNMTSITFGYI
ncbi:hypothetical protein ES705_44177 [subsurface metagenome]